MELANAENAQNNKTENHTALLLVFSKCSPFFLHKKGSIHTEWCTDQARGVAEL